MSAFEAELAVGLQVSFAPCFGSLFYAVVFGVPVFCSSAPGFGQLEFVLFVDLSWHGSEVGFVELAVFDAGVCHECVGGASCFVYAHVEFAAGQCAFDAAEEDGYAVGLHLRVGGNEFVLVGLGVEVEEVVFFGVDFAALVEFAAVDADVVVFGCDGDAYQFLWFGLYVVDVAECFEEDEGYGCRRGEAADGEAAFDDAAQSGREGIAFAEFECDASQVVCPVVFFVSWHVADVELCAFVELQ